MLAYFSNITYFILLFIIMYKRASYVLKLSLTEIALRRVVVSLWNESNLLATIAKTRYNPRNYFEKLKKWHEIVEGKVSKLVLPELLKKRMTHILRDIGSEIGNWRWFHETYLSDSIAQFDVPILEKLCWTSLGTIDYKKTAEELIRCEMVDIVNRYILACLYCLENSIALLWDELPDECKRCFYVEDLVRVRRLKLECYWPYILKGHESALSYIREGEFISFYQHAFERSALNGNRVATEYFLKKLTAEVKDFSLLSTVCSVLESRERRSSHRFRQEFPEGKLSDVFFYLFSLMSSAEQMHVLNEYTCVVLRCFLDWPLQVFLKDIADLILAFLPESRFYYVLRGITLYVRGAGYNFPSLFQQFFVKSPSDCRKQFVDRECDYCSFFPELFRVEDKRTIKVIFRNIDPKDRVKLMTCYNFFQLFDDLLMEGKGQIVEFCFREAIRAKEERELVKVVFMGYLTGFATRDVRWRKRTWKRFFHFLDGTGKRKSKKDSKDEAKEVCSKENILPRN